MPSLEGNIWRYQLFCFLDYFALFPPFIVYYFQELGFSLAQIALLNSATALSLFMLEIPSGYFADRYGRKSSLLVGVFLQALAMLMLYLAKGFPMLFVCHIILGAAVAFISGADSAFLYDTLLSMGKERRYKIYDGKARFFSEVSIIISALFGTLIVRYGISYTILYSIISHAVLFLFALSFVEPPRHKPIEKLSFSKEIASLKGIVIRSVSNKRLLMLFIYSFIALGVSNTIFLNSQPYMRATGVPLDWFGVVFASFSVFTAIGALKAHSIEKRFGMFWSLMMIPLLLLVSLLGLGFFFALFGFLFFFAREFMRGFVHPVLGDYTNRIVSSHERATVLSVQSMFARLGFVVISLIFGFFADIHGLRVVLLSEGMIFLALILAAYLFFRRYSHLLVLE